MLENLKILNLAVIPKADIYFKPGLNIISGETGAGKSIVLQAISLILGGRANADLVRKDCEEAIVEGYFDTQQMPWVSERLSKQGLPAVEDELLVKRVLHKNGRSRIFINGELATLSILQQVCEGLIDLCGQHEHQALLKPTKQVQLLDRYGGLEKQSLLVTESLGQRREFLDQLQALRQGGEELERQADFLRFQIEELKAAELKEGEDAELQAEKESLQTVGIRGQKATSIGRLLDQEEAGALDLIRQAQSQMQALIEKDESLQAAMTHLQSALAELEELSLLISRYSEALDADPSRLEQVQERLALIASLRRKYGGSSSEMLETLANLQAQLEKVEGSEERAKEISKEIEKIEAHLSKSGQKLSAARQNVAKMLSESVTREIQDLKMSGAYLKVNLQYLDSLDDWSLASGPNSISFDVCTNKGDDLKPLVKIASGGELSRLMLAIRRVIADKGGIGVYLFDEIDAGMGGQTAFEVGRKLKAVSKYNQVICITHLAQVASFADHHVSVQKLSQNKKVVTQVLALQGQEVKEEIARMLGGPKLTPSSLKNAAEMLKMAH